MSKQVLANEAQPCVWMCAGVLRYRLCPYEFDCDNCLLDSALRGDGQRRRPTVPSEYAAAFPADRSYGAGHTWVQAVPGSSAGVWRLGLDAFAAAMVADTRRVSWDDTPWTVQPGDTVCTLDVGLGELSVRSPLRARVLRNNEILHVHPERVVTAPYDAGWLVELTMIDADDLDALHAPEAARKAAMQDLRKFRRAVALSLLDDLDGGWGGNCDDLAVHDLRWLLAGGHYMEFLGALVH